MNNTITIISRYMSSTTNVPQGCQYDEKHRGLCEHHNKSHRICELTSTSVSGSCEHMTAITIKYSYLSVTSTTLTVLSQP
jgi:hypothetical protein